MYLVIALERLRYPYGDLGLLAMIVYRIFIVQCFSFKQASTLHITTHTTSIPNNLCSTLDWTVKHSGSIRSNGLDRKLIRAYLIPKSALLEQFKGVAWKPVWSWTIAFPSYFSYYQLRFLNASIAALPAPRMCAIVPKTAQWLFPISLFFTFWTAPYSVILFIFALTTFYR